MQCFVLLLRPLFLKQISYLLAGDTLKAYQEDLKYLTNTCLRAARTNLKIIIDLRSCDRMGKPLIPHQLYRPPLLTRRSPFRPLGKPPPLLWPNDPLPGDGCQLAVARQF